jgi:hypothetical protein
MWKYCLVIQSADSGRQKILLELRFCFCGTKIFVGNYMYSSLKFKKPFFMHQQKVKKW